MGAMMKGPSPSFQLLKCFTMKVCGKFGMLLAIIQLGVWVCFDMDCLKES
jgi:hypothetical protein